MMISRTVAVVVLTSLLLAGCAPQTSTTSTDAATAPPASETPTPAPTPVKPAISDLVVTPEGIEDVALGEAPRTANAATDLLVFVEGYCQPAIDDYIERNGSDPGVSPDKWVANFEPALSGESDKPFAVAVTDGDISLISINDPDLQTAEGVGLGSSRAELLAAYPDAQPVEGSIAEASELFVIEGERGRIELEIALTNEVVGLQEATLNTVWSFRVTDSAFEPTSWAGIDAGSAVNCIPA